jgi:hypothetical protein
MKPTKTLVVPAHEEPSTGASHAHHPRRVMAIHSVRILAEIPTTLRRLSLLLLVLAISIPIFFAGLLIILWQLAH